MHIIIMHMKKGIHAKIIGAKTSGPAASMPAAACNDDVLYAC